MSNDLLGAVEAGGTKFVCLVGRGPDAITATTTLPTTDPGSTLDATIAFFREQAGLGPSPVAIGVGSFGPVELRRSQPDYGCITRTPKPGWSGTDMAGAIGNALSVPVGFDTDVNGAALGEGRWGAARNDDTFAYVTVGTGVGVGIVAAGHVLHGLVHPEAGHMAVRRMSNDSFAGSCPYHGDCLEGMASGSALAARYGKPATELDDDAQAHAADVVAWYLADGLRNLIYAVAPERIIVGGGVSELPELMPRLRDRLARSLGGYPGVPDHQAPDFLIRPGLGSLAGVLGALVLAEQAATRQP